MPSQLRSKRSFCFDAHVCILRSFCTYARNARYRSCISAAVVRIHNHCQFCRLQHGLGMQVVAKSGLANGNHVCTSFVLNSGDVTFMVTAPHGTTTAQDDARCPFPGYSRDAAFDFVKKHGVAVRAVGEISPNCQLQELHMHASPRHAPACR